MSNESRKSSTVGEIVNLMLVDVQRQQDLIALWFICWTVPLNIALAMYLLYRILGPSVFAGLGLLILLLPINIFIVWRQKKLQVF